VQIKFYEIQSFQRHTLISFNFYMALMESMRLKLQSFYNMWPSGSWQLFTG